MLEYDPEKRATAAECLNHPWLDIDHEDLFGDDLLTGGIHMNKHHHHPLRNHRRVALDDLDDDSDDSSTGADVYSESILHHRH